MNKIIIAVFAMFVLFAFGASAKILQVQDCNLGLGPMVWINGDTAKIEIPQGGCAWELTFAVYSFEWDYLPFENQVLHQYVTETLGPGINYLGPLDLPCNYQTDVYFGPVRETIPPEGFPVLAAYVSQHNTCTVCGDGIVEPPEECEPNVYVYPFVPCNDDCTFVVNAICGDGIITPPEECDDGNSIDGDGCSSFCTVDQVLPYCGDGIITPPEQCDDGNNNNGDGCSSSCTIENTPQKLVPIGECVNDNGDGSFTAFWGYNNPNAGTVVIPVGVKNFFMALSGPPINQNQGQPTNFLSGVHNNVFATVFTSAGLSWTLDGNTAALTQKSTRCNSNDIPEFGTIGAAFALAGAGAYLYRRRK